ncbi:MAG TPA: hypothetical protein VGX23_25340 [Actinocrinis sp.]|nr:hypothetical protein [Actinocrinis sp.]
MTMLGSTLAVCAVAGTVLGTSPAVLTADQKPAAVAATSKPARPDVAPQELLDMAPAQAVPVASPPAPTAAPTTAAPAPTHAPTHAPAQAPAPAKSKAPAPKKPVSQPPAKSDPYAGESAYKIAQQLVPSSQFGCFDWIVTRESGWNVQARNPSSGAYGLGQALPGSKMASAGPDWETNPTTQIKWTLGYMDSRYGSPCGAQSFWEAHSWY